MIFAIELDKKMEKKYPGFISKLTKFETTRERLIHTRMIDSEDGPAVLALAAWRSSKIIYDFDKPLAHSLITNTDFDLEALPLATLKHPPYKAFAVSIVPMDIRDPVTDKVKVAYCGNLFIWLDGDVLYSAWENDSGKFELQFVDLSNATTFSEVFGNATEHVLQTFGFQGEKLTLLKKLLDIESFNDLREITSRHHSRVRNRLGMDSYQSFIAAVNAANLVEATLRTIIDIILYLNSVNADVESRAERLRNPQADSSEHIRKTRAKQLRQEMKDSTVLDVGYRIASPQRPRQDSVSSSGIGSGTKRGYGTRRAHFHHYWIGPRDGKIAADIYHPGEGEKGLVLYYLEETEIHPELKDNKAIIVPVE